VKSYFVSSVVLSHIPYALKCPR